MIGQIFIGSELIGEVDFKMMGGMGGIGGDLIPNKNYEKYQPFIQSHYERNGISNIDDFDFKIILDGVELKPEGGIGITDSSEFNEIIVESAGLDQITLEKLRIENS
jgi:hypothetical protein